MDVEVTEPADGEKPELTSESIVQAALNIESGEIENHLTFLSSDLMGGRLTGSPQFQEAAGFVEGKYREYGLEPKGSIAGSFRQPFQVNDTRLGLLDAENIIGFLPGKKDSREVIVVGAHLDHIGQNNQAIYNGADDNASGVVGLLGIAKALSSFKGKLDRHFLFIAFGAEELGLRGSEFFVSNPTVALNTVAFMLNMDMIGYSEGSIFGIRFDRTIGMRELIDERQLLYPIEVVFDNSKDGMSDHIPFANSGIPVGVLHTGLHENYHEPTDTVEKCDIQGLTTTIQLAIDVLIHTAQLDSLGQKSFRLAPETSVSLSSDGLHSHHGLKPAFWEDDRMNQYLQGF